MATILRIILYGILATLIGVNLYIFLNKNKDETPKITRPTIQTADLSNPPESPAPTLPPVPVPTPAVQEIIKAVDDSSSLAKGAKESFEKGDFRKAAELCSQLAAREKKAFLCAGLSYFKLSDYDNAITCLEQALEGGADEFPCRKYLAFSYYYRDNFEKSLINAEKGVAILKDAELNAFYDRLMREKKSHRNFVSESTTHFRVQFDGYELGGISRKVIGILEDAYSSIGSDLNYYPSEPVTVILYTNHDFYDTTQAPGWMGGYFDTKDGKIRLPVRGAEGQDQLLRTVIYHEYVHSLIHSITKSCPLWIHEGLAEYFSKGPSQKVGQVIPLNYLEKSFSGLSGRSIYLAYIESHSAVSYLMDRYRADRMKTMLVSLSNGNNLNRAFSDAFQISYTDFIEKWGRK
jgi:tetratricopeptide (TPR) repeat protein